MKFMLRMFFAFTIIFGAIACSGGEKSSTDKAKPAAKPATKTDAKADEMAAIIRNGKKLYVQHCSACHMPKGNGIPGLNPPLIETDWVTGDKDRMVAIVVNGLHEEIEVNGQKYQGPMIGLPYLKDQEISDILTYVRDRFGKGASPITLEEVTAARAKL